MPGPLSATAAAAGSHVSWEDVLGLLNKTNPDSRIPQNLLQSSGIPAPPLTEGGNLDKVVLFSASVFFSPKKVQCLGWTQNKMGPQRGVPQYMGLCWDSAEVWGPFSTIHTLGGVGPGAMVAPALQEMIK